jgi:hypothetical protein
LAFALCSLVIANRSPERVLETGLLVKAPEKNLSNESKVAGRSFSLVRFAEQMSRRCGLFRVFHGQRNGTSLQLRLRGGGS